jgi:hypothetical protein
LGAHLHDVLKQNLATVRRNKPTEADLVGNIEMAVPLQFEILHQKNSLPFSSEIVCDQLLGKVLSQKSATPSLIRIPAFSDKIVNRKIFEPVSIIDQQMYEEGTKTSLAELEAHIKHMPAIKGRNAYATVAVGTLAYEGLVLNLNRRNWQEEHEQLDLDHIMNPGKSRTVEVTPKIATQLFEKLSAPIAAIPERCVDLKNLVFSLRRGDGEKQFNSRNGLIGQSTSSSVDPRNKLPAGAVTERGIVYAACELTYFLW